MKTSYGTWSIGARQHDSAPFIHSVVFLEGSLESITSDPMGGPSISVLGGADISAVQRFELGHRKKAEVTEIYACQCERAIALDKHPYRMGEQAHPCGFRPLLYYLNSLCVQEHTVDHGIFDHDQRRPLPLSHSGSCSSH
jgi:hypothetical protein